MQALIGPAVASDDVCYNSPLSAFIYTDETQPVPAPGDQAGWYFEHPVPSSSKINWYSYNINAPSGTSVNPGSTLAYSDIATVYAVVNFLDCPAAYPTFEGPYFVLYTQDCVNYPGDAPACFYLTNVQWRFPALTPLCGRVLLWAGTTAPPLDLHADVGARFELTSVLYSGRFADTVGIPPEAAEVVTYIGVGTDSNNPGTLKAFTVEAEGYIGTSLSLSQDITLSFCPSPTEMPTATPTSAQTPKPSPNPKNPKPTPKPTPKTPPKPTPKPTPKPSAKPKAFFQAE